MSAKKMTGAKKILDVLAKTREDTKSYKHLPKVYVVGPTNTGKSTMLNAMLLMQGRKKDKKAQKILTESALSGTTQTMMTVEQFKIGFKVIDTPGIPNSNTVQAQVKTYFELGSLLPRRKMTSLSLNVKQGYCVWLGALARLDFVSGDDKHLTFICPTDVTIHRTPIERAQDVFMK